MTLLDKSLGDLARSIPGATGVLHEYRLDFCCGGQHSLREAAVSKGIAPEVVAARLAWLQASPASERDWRGAGNRELIGHILERFHARHREQLPELIRLARRVEQVHVGNPDCPEGLADHLEGMRQELESHMLKEEQVLFPLLSQGGIERAGGPVSVMRYEHEQHGEALARIEELTNDITPPARACNTWRALYLGLATLRQDLMQHIHLENNILFEGLAAAPVRSTGCACASGSGAGGCA